MDAIDLLTEQHRYVDVAFEELRALPATATDERGELIERIITDLSVHAGIEEVAFYPTVREAMSGVDDELDHDLEEHQEAKQLLADLQKMSPSDDGFEATFDRLVAAIRHHVEEEEQDLFPRVREALDEEELRELGETMEQLMSVVPTNPHPHAPQRPPANLVAGPAAGALDRIRDRIRGRRNG